MYCKDNSFFMIAKAILKIRKEFRGSLSVAELAQTVGMSQSTFIFHFKFVTGTTPLQYQKDLRIIASRDLLRSGSSVSSTSFNVGYKTPSHFSNDFQRRFGLAPSKLAKVTLEYERYFS